MTVRRPPAPARAAARLTMRMLAASWRVRTVHEERWRAVYDTGRPHVFMCWHEAMLPLLWRHRGQGIAIVVSEALEGDYLVDFAASIGYRAVRGSSHRGAMRALLGAVKELRAGHSVAFTPDGPTGPHRQVKPGVVAAAQRGEAVIVPLHADAGRAWRLRSWDRMMIPKPFAPVRIAYGVPFVVAAGKAGLSQGVERARAGLEDAFRMAAWPEDGATPTG